jgi:hypothetical protein
MPRLFRRLSVIFICLALFGITVVVCSDGWHHLHYSSSHQQLGALPLIAIGLAYMIFQLGAERCRGERAKGMLLGLAFVLWGSEQLLPPSSWVTVMDDFVITIFVVDLALMIVGNLRRGDQSTREPASTA